MRKSSTLPFKDFKLKSSNIVTLDFETYYSQDYTLSGSASLSEYVRDPQFKVHCVAIKIGKGKTYVYDDKTAAKAIKSIDWSKYALLAQNTAFDGFILSEHYGVVPAYYLDLMSMSKGLHGVCMRHDLDTISKVYGRSGKVQGSLKKTKGIRDLPDELLEPLMYYCQIDVDETRGVFDPMWSQFPQGELDLIDLTIRLFCDSPLQVDVALAKKLADKEREETERLIEQSGATRDELNSNPKFAKLLSERGIPPPVKISNRTGTETFAFAKNDPEFEDLLNHDRIEISDLVRARLAAKSTIGETRALRFATAGETGGLPAAYGYFNAHTGRWGGTNKTNMQNLNRAKYDDMGEVIPMSDALRRSIVAPKGHVLVVADSAQIELRVNAWLAGFKEKLDIIQKFDAGELPDMYCVTASRIYGREIDKKRDPMERHVGKTAELGLGYQMGALKFQGSLIRGTPSVELPLTECKQVVSLYRQINKPIVDQWRFFQNWLVSMTDWQPGQLLEGEYGPNGVIRWTHNGCPSLLFPDGLGIHYPGLMKHVDMNGRNAGYSYCVTNARKYVYGGALTENVVQRLARSVIAHQMLILSRMWRVVMMTHDEIVCCVPEKLADKCLDSMLEVLRIPPDWASGLPLNATGGYDRCYSK